MTNTELSLPPEKPKKSVRWQPASIAWYICIIATGIAAIHIAYSMVCIVQMTERAKTWEAVPGILKEKDLKTVFVRSGVDDMEKTVATYSYTVDGKTYEGNRIDFVKGLADNFSKSRRERQKDLLTSVPLNVYIDPQNPAESVIDRSFPAEKMLFFTVFLLFPCGLSVMLMIGTLLLPFGKRWYKLTSPLTGIFHGGIAFGILVFYHASYGIIGGAILALMSCLFFAGIFYLVRHDKLDDKPWQQSD